MSLKEVAQWPEEGSVLRAPIGSKTGLEVVTRRAACTALRQRPLLTLGDLLQFWVISDKHSADRDSTVPITVARGQSAISQLVAANHAFHEIRRD